MKVLKECKKKISTNLIDIMYNFHAIVVVFSAKFFLDIEFIYITGIKVGKSRQSQQELIYTTGLGD